MAKVALSYGHGADTYEKKRSKFVAVNGKVYEEHTFNATVGEKVRKIIEAHGVKVLVVQPPFGSDVPLKVRTDKANAWGADIYWSIHANAGAPSARGLCGFYYKGSAKGKKLAELYAKYCKAEKFPAYHGYMYESQPNTWSDFHELRETKMPALLTENGFMTNPEDFKLIFENKDNFHDRLARVHAKAILEYFGIKYDPVKAGEIKTTQAIKKPTPKPQTKPTPKPSVKKGIRRVIVDGKQVGAFSQEKNVLEQVEKALKNGANKIYIEEV
jgi:hypothetical protein